MLLKTGSIDVIKATASAAAILKEPKIGIILKISSTVASRSNFVWDTDNTYDVPESIGLLMLRHGPDAIYMTIRHQNKTNGHTIKTVSDKYIKLIPSSFWF